MNKQYKADLALLVVTLSWGISFILTKNSLDALATFNFLSIRFFIAGIICIVVFHKKILKIDKTTIKYGVLIGFTMFLGYAFQTAGLNYTTASKSAFISSLCVIFVPIFSALLLKKPPKLMAIAGVIFSTMGLALLTLDGNLSLNIGDFYSFLCAICFALQILAIAKYSAKADPINLAILQITVVCILSMLISFLFESPTIPTSKNVWIDIVSLSFFCTSGAFIIQNIAQKYTSTTHAALIFTGEPVFAAIFGYFIAGEILSTRGFVGGILIVSSILLVELKLKSPFLKRPIYPKKRQKIATEKK
ncbi:DMT family transporter [Marinisporobacter balticus]|uniref:Drug/metabolite transporter (DMT)-like permease n=1 Tax=Marinisporobacter balticus TaxID=2018667 RepID=A0A4R2KG16_9FIRM|nr:DMT family transporter [Marinisporobacter balticus]TCO69339.1 drug/metabolite transporter (DMT)-like permease [Marinisporobacter balticus]